jgi:SEC-C motif
VRRSHADYRSYLKGARRWALNVRLASDCSCPVSRERQTGPVERPRRNDPCHCGSGKKYKQCHLDADAASDRIERLRCEIPPADPASMAEVMPILEAKLAKEQETDRRLREEYGVHINYVRPVQWQGGKVWAIGSRVYPGRPPTETFHEFILHVLRGTLGEPWRAEQAALPVERRHFVLRCFDELARFKAQLDAERLKREGIVSAEPDGWVS